MNKRVYLLIFVGIAAIVSFIFDREIALWATSLRVVWLTPIVSFITYLGSFIYVIYLIISIFLWLQKKREFIMPLWLGLLLAAGLTYIIKIIVARPRPEAIGIVALVTSATVYSFPSGHSSTSFAALPVLDKAYPKFKTFWFIFVALVALSRLYLGMHYLSDIIVGATLGYLVTEHMLKLKDKKLFKRLDFFVKG